MKNIVINSRSGETARRVLCAHELGHALLHGHPAAMCGFPESALLDARDPVEDEANLFAAELIISDEDLLECLNDSDPSFPSIAQTLSAPTELLAFKLRALTAKGCRVEAQCVSASDFLKHRAVEYFE